MQQRKKLTVEQVALIRTLYVDDGMTNDEIADLFGVSHTQVNNKIRLEHLTKKEIEKHFENYYKRHPESKYVSYGQGMKKTFKPK